MFRTLHLRELFQIVLALVLFSSTAFTQETSPAESSAPSHWAFQPLTRPLVPQMSDSSWAQNPIDAFIFNKLQEQGLSPAPDTNPATLIRRAHYAVTGLPPSPEAVQAFVAEYSEERYEALIDELLASPHYGEQWGRHWLDLVRYAETNGYERDSMKPHIWRYRDYVINSFNQDKPYNDFVQEQLAGDELENAGPEQLIATGYYRLGLWDDEPADPMQGKFDDLDDIVSTTANVFLGLSIGCARCHDHKIEPIPQDDYYSFLAFFHNIQGFTRGKDMARSILPSDQEKERKDQISKNRKAINDLNEKLQGLEQVFLVRYREDHSTFGQDLAPSDMTEMHYRFYRDSFDVLPDFDMLRHENEGDLPHGFFDISVRTRNTHYGFVFEAMLTVPEAGEYTFYLDSDDGTRLRLDGDEIILHDGVHGLNNEQKTTLQLVAGTFPIRLDYFQKTSGLGLKVAWSGPGFERRPLSFDMPELDIPKLVQEHGAEYLSEKELKQRAFYQKRLQDRKNFQVPGEFALAVEEFGAEAPPTHLLTRGNPHAPGKEVPPAFPTALGGHVPDLPVPDIKSTTTGRRKVLADWLTRPDNQLTARVLMNRIWQYNFGRGIVRSANDFGVGGMAPTHPELLNWLAADFVEGGWTLKRMQKMLLLSRTFRMASDRHDANYAKDPDNNFFWHFDMRRLTAEELRDSILAANGSINLKLGGESVYPPMPKEILATSSQPENAWGKSPVEDHTRRTIYTHVKRSLLAPLLTDFDLADTDSSCPVRFSTVQPTQALNLMNSEFLNKQAVALGNRVREESPDDMDAQLTRAIALCSQRQPRANELEQAHQFIEDMKRDFGHNDQTAIDRFCLLALNLNEFIFLD